jgi:hypothetical protein
MFLCDKTYPPGPASTSIVSDSCGGVESLMRRKSKSSPDLQVKPNPASSANNFISGEIAGGGTFPEQSSGISSRRLCLAKASEIVKTANQLHGLPYYRVD